MAENPVRPCFGCQKFDTHPRHEIYGSNEPMHKDCCAEQRGCQVCAYERDGLAPTVIGDAFREHLLSLPPVQVVHVDNDDDGDPLNLTTATVTPLEG
jgi:hypothetical protein